MHIPRRSALPDGFGAAAGVVVRGPWSLRLDETKAFEVLVGLGRRRLRPLSAESLALHVLRLYPGAGFTVQRAAFEAVLERFGRVRGSELRVARRPSHGAVLGTYRVRGDSDPGAEHDLLLRCVEPLDASCDCVDFRRASLGLCVHVLAVLVEIAEAPDPEEADPGGRVFLDPVRPLTGPGDPLAQIRFRSDPGGRPPFCRVPAGSDGDALVLAGVHAEQSPARRLVLVERVERWLEARGASDPAVRALLAEERRRLAPRVRAEHEREKSLAALDTMKRPLYPYQREGVERFLRATRLLLADDMGLGKTVQAIAACHALFVTERVRRGLVVVPASLKDQWLWEWESFTDTPIAVVGGHPSARRAVYARTDRGFLVLSYELVRRDLEALRDWAPEAVVLDEAQRIKNRATQTAAAVKRLAPSYRLALTGTPLENRLDELASVMDWVDARAMEPTWRLAPLHHTPEGAHHLGTLRQRLAPSMLRRRRSDVLRQLPPRTDTVVPIALDRAQRRLHRKLSRPIAQLVKQAKRRRLTAAEHTRLMGLLTTQRIVCNGLAQLRFEQVWPALEHQFPDDACLATLASPKLVALRELIGSVVLVQRRKVVVFSQWRRMLQLAEWAVGDLLDAEDLNAVFFTGTESLRQRTRSLVAFHDEPSVPVLFATDAGGVGLNLQRAASCCVQLEVPWNPAVFEQRVARIHRPGQSVPIDVITLVTQGSIEQRIARLASAKRALFDGLLDSRADAVAFEHAESLASRLEDLVDPFE